MGDGIRSINQPGFRKRLYLSKPALAVLIAAISVSIIIAVAPEFISGYRIVRDDTDRGIYMDRGSFAVTPNARPYKDVWSEYPQLATYIFAIPFVGQLVHPVDRKMYMDIFTVMMALLLYAFAIVWLKVSRKINVRAMYVLWLLLPGTLYFALNRYDLIPAFLVLCSFALLFYERPVAAHAILAIAFLTKAYPILLLPLLAVQTIRQAGWRRFIIGLAVFFGVIIAFSVQLALWSGIDAVFAPFKFQLGRDLNDESFYYLLTGVFPWSYPAIKWIFLGLQGALALAVLWFRPRTPRQTLRWITAIVIAFVLFNRFQSPQWVVWITPIALLAAVTPFEIALVAFQDLFAYFYFPLIFDQVRNIGADPWMLPTVIWCLSIMRLALIAAMLRPSGKFGLPDLREISFEPVQKQPSGPIAN
jgi:hypothetical protein